MNSQKSVETTTEDRAKHDDSMILSTQLLEDASEEVLASQESQKFASIFTRNAVSVGRLIVASVVALVIPAYLTHKLPVATYSAWILILQLGGYIAYLDFGVQNGISKYISEFEAKSTQRRRVQTLALVWLDG